MFGLACRISFGIALLVLSSRAVQAQNDEYYQQVGVQLVQNLSAAQVAGMSLSHDPWKGLLKEGWYRDHPIQLDAGVRYAITAACDADCGDIDLTLYNRDGVRIDSDVSSDDRPVIVVQPTESSRFDVRASMINCKVDPCAYGLGVFSDE
jgi:hypothetical protein